jgi:Domain of unknown function (DUF4352)
MMRVRSATQMSVAAVGVALLVGACSHDASTPGSSAAATPSATTGSTTAASGSKPASPKPPPVSTVQPLVAVSTKPAGGVGDKAALAPGIQVVVSKVKNVQVKASGPGDVAGPGVSVDLVVTNSSSKPLDLGGLAVTASYGKKNLPASPGGAETGDPLSGTLKPGRTARGSYVFTVPKSQAASLQVQVSSDAAPDILVFQR